MIRRVLTYFGALPPARIVALGYAWYVLVGWLLLSLPFSQQDGVRVGSLDQLFTATSAVSTTGLVSVSPSGSFSFFGELVILSLIQIGGIGYMTAGSFFVLTRGGKLSTLRKNVSASAFSLPEGFRVETFVRRVVLFTFCVEAVGALLLWARFVHLGVADPIWSAVFHSVSAFCTAGFSLYDGSLESFRRDFWINTIVSALALGGAIGFIVFSDWFSVLARGKQRTTLTSRIIVYSTLWLLFGGTLLLFVTEPAFASLPPSERVMTSFFQAMTATTTVGFNTFPISGVSSSSIVLVSLLMIVGASPSGTGGGIKSTSVSAMVGLVRSVLRDRPQITFWGHPIPDARVRFAAAAVSCYLGTLAVGAFLLLLTEPHSFEDVVFEAASALGTVGLSRGITGDLTPLGQIVIVALMYLGRMGPLALIFAIMSSAAEDGTPEDLAV